MTAASPTQLAVEIDARLPSATQATISMLASLANSLGSQRFLPSGNRYCTGGTAAIDSDAAASNLDQTALSEYIAISGIAHCMDGWSYLGRSLSALTNGDSHVSHHLAYYAELRAAMSMLATRGIGVFEHRHYMIVGPSTCDQLPLASGTHVAAARLLDAWATAPDAAAAFARVIRPMGLPFDAWTSEWSRVSLSSAGTVAAHWLSLWSLDISQITNDRDQRNLASYRPTAFYSTTVASARESADFLSLLWTFLEPNGAGGFDNVDSEIVRHTLVSTYESRFGRHPDMTQLDRTRFDRFLTAMLQGLGIVSATGTASQARLVQSLSSAASPLFDISTRPSRIEDPRYHFSTIVRASLLLRVATGLCVELFNAAGIGPSKLAFWWHRIGENRGYWQVGSMPSNLMDLWSDVEDALYLVTDWVNSAAQPSYSSWHTDCSMALATLNGTERIPLWSMSP